MLDLHGRLVEVAACSVAAVLAQLDLIRSYYFEKEAGLVSVEAEMAGTRQIPTDLVVWRAVA